MSKREFKKYIKDLKKSQLEIHLFDLYERFSNVKEFYDFAFNPNEVKLVKEAKFKIANEFFPLNGRKAKMRRSIAQKIIKHFITLGVDIFIISDIMLYTIEIAQSFSVSKCIKNDSFYKSIFITYRQSILYMVEHAILNDNLDRVVAIKNEAIIQDWSNKSEFVALAQQFDY